MGNLFDSMRGMTFTPHEAEAIKQQVDVCTRPIDEPETPGWYRGRDGSAAMIFLLNGNHDWYAITAGGETTKCVWPFISQGGEVQRMVDLDGNPPTPAYTL